ncbi:hypothetical protein BH09PLA1_BH09PLA1_03470 [soil metagenome]
MSYKKNTGPKQVEILEKRVLFSSINVADFGAIPNDGIDDRSAIQQAIDHAIKGDKVLFNAGTFNLNGQVALKGGITLTSASGKQDALLDSKFGTAPGNGWVNGSNFAFKAGDVTGLTVNNLKFKANGGIFNFSKADQATFTNNDFEWGYDGNYYNRHAFWVSSTADGLIIDSNHFHDSEKSDRNLEIWGWANGSYSYNNFYKINDGGHIMNPGHNFLLKGNVGRLIHRMGVEIQQDRYAPTVWSKNLVIEDNVFSDWNKPYWDSMGMSVPVAGEGVTIRNNYIKQNAFNGEWGQPDSSGKVRGSYGIEAPQAPSGQAGGIVEGNTIISERNVMAVSAPGKNTVVRNNKFYGSYTWSVVGGEPGSLGYGSVDQSNNLHEKDHRKGPDVPTASAPTEETPAAPIPTETPQNDAPVPEPTPAPKPKPQPAPTPISFTYLSDLEWASVLNGWGVAELDRSNGEGRSNDGGNIRLNNRIYEKGIGVANDSEIVYELDGQYAKFLTDIGIDDSMQHKGQLTFEVWADGKKIYDSGVVRGNADTQSLKLNVEGVQQLKLVTISAADGPYDHGNWAGARLQ